VPEYPVSLFHRKIGIMNIVPKIGTALLLSAVMSLPAQAQGLKGLINSTKKTIGTIKTGTGTGTGSLSESDIAAGLKEALQVGTKNATGKVSAVNGFFADQAIKVLLPPEARKIETALRAVGMGAQVDRAILSMNRAAEDASSKAVPIFVDAITSMSIQDGLTILKGSNDAATQYLKGRTTAQLTTAFRPVIQASLNKVNATAYWREMVTLYNKLPTTRQKLNPDLTGWVTERSLNGIFVYVAQEEGKIRTNPAARISDILRKVFGQA
jgi:hypothetical protein